jgi:site-specific DNA-cytosine methylase
LIAGGQRGTDGNTGQLFLDDAEGALETDAPIIASEIVLGILDEKLITYLKQKFERLRARYVTCWRVLRCNQHGDKFTNRRRMLIVGIKQKFLRKGLSAENVGLFPPDRPADVSPGLEAVIFGPNRVSRK